MYSSPIKYFGVSLGPKYFGVCFRLVGRLITRHFSRALFHCRFFAHAHGLQCPAAPLAIMRLDLYFLPAKPSPFKLFVCDPIINRLTAPGARPRSHSLPSQLPRRCCDNLQLPCQRLPWLVGCLKHCIVHVIHLRVDDGFNGSVWSLYGYFAFSWAGLCWLLFLRLGLSLSLITFIHTYLMAVNLFVCIKYT